MKHIIKLTQLNGEPILIGTESIIDVTKVENVVSGVTNPSKIQSRGAMIQTNWVVESVDEIYQLINNQTL